MRWHCALPQVADADFHQAVCSVCLYFQDCGQRIVLHVLAPDGSIEAIVDDDRQVQAPANVCQRGSKPCRAAKIQAVARSALQQSGPDAMVHLGKPNRAPHHDC